MNNSSLGEFSILIALVFCIWGFVNSALGGSRRDPKLAEVGRRAAIPTFLFATFALIVLEVALLTNDTITALGENRFLVGRSGGQYFALGVVAGRILAARLENRQKRCASPLCARHHVRSLDVFLGRECHRRQSISRGSIATD
jgi:hypothetical protein